MRITFKKVYQNKRASVEWDLRRNPAYDDFRPIPTAKILLHEFLLEDDPRVTPERLKDCLVQVGLMPCFEDLNEEDLVDLMKAKAEIQKFMTECAYKPDWFKGEFDRLSDHYEHIMSARQAEADREERRAQFEDLRGALEKTASPSKTKPAVGDIPDDVGPDYFDPKVKAIRDFGKNVPEKLTTLFLLDPKYRDFSHVAQAKLIGATPEAVRNALLRMRKKAADLKKKEDEMEG